MSRHSYTDCDGAEYLTSLSTSWFISYLYYLTIDPSHLNWQKYKERISLFEQTRQYHTEWLKQAINRNPLRLDKNQIGLKGTQILTMAQTLLTFQNNSL